MDKRIIWALCVLVCIAPALATSYYEKASTINWWYTDPCVTQAINTTNDFTVIVNGYVCQSALAGQINWFEWKTAGCGANFCNGLVAGWRCDNTSIKIIAYWGDSNVQDTGWHNISKPNITLNDKYNPLCAAGFSLPTPYNASYANREITDADGCSWYLQIPEYETTVKMNKSGYYQMRIYLKSSTNTSITPATALINYTVTSEGGVLPGNCTSRSAATTIPIGTDAISVTLGENKALWWAFLMIAVGAFVFFIGGRGDPALNSVKLAVMGIMELLLLVIGSYLKIISWVILGVIFVFLVMIVAMKIKEIFT